MDVRCEKCQTEYELDESRLKPGGVTVKCTNCGHMFKIRKRTPTNVGIPATDEGPTVRSPPRARTESNKDGLPSSIADGGSGPTERNWLVRLENGEQKTCRELATLQQWIVAGVATRESLISRTGKTWKRLGDIAELRQYFDIADEARSKRAARPTPGVSPSPPPPSTPPPASSLEESPTDRFASSAAKRSTAPSAPPPAPAPAPPRTAPPPPEPPKADPRAATEIQTTPNQRPQPQLGRESVPWASSELKPTASIAAMPQGPSGGKFSVVKDEPAFAGRVRMDPGDDSSFDTNRVRADVDDDPLPARAPGSRAGTWIAVASLLVIAGAAGAVYMFLFAKPSAVAQKDAGAAVAAAQDAGVGSASVKPIAVDAAVAAHAADPLDEMRGELASGVEPRLKGLYDSLAGKTDGPSLAMRARLGAALAQSQLDRAALEADRGAAEKLRKAAKQLAIEVSALAQKALKAKADDPYANLAMADVLRVQGKTAHDVDRYLQIAKAKAGGDPQIQRAVAVAAAQTDLRDNFYDDVHKDLGAFESADDTAVHTVLALAAFAQNKPDDARPLVAKILAASPDHDVARALDKRLAVAVATTDPLPPEDHGTPGKHPAQTPGPGPSGANSGDLSGDYDALVRKADALADTNCARATDIYNKALEQKPTGVEALTGIGYCNLNAKQFSSAFSKFKTALAVSSHYEPALAGVAETYQQQGNKEQAIASWHAYLDAYPGAEKAKRQLEILGESDHAGGTSTAQGSAAPAPAPVPAPAPAPTPAPPPAPAPAPAPAPSAGSAAG